MGTLILFYILQIPRSESHLFVKVIYGPKSSKLTDHVIGTLKRDLANSSVDFKFKELQGRSLEVTAQS